MYRASDIKRSGIFVFLDTHENPEFSLLKRSLSTQVSIIAKNISISTQQIEKCRFSKYVFHLVHEANS